MSLPPLKHFLNSNKNKETVGSMQVKLELIKLLLEIGFIGVDNRQVAEAETIFEGASILRPGNSTPDIGFAAVAIRKGEYEKAISILRNAPFKDAGQKDLRDAFLGKSLKLAGYNMEAQSVLEDVVSNGEDKSAIEMAEELLEIDLSSL